MLHTQSQLPSDSNDMCTAHDTMSNWTHTSPSPLQDLLHASQSYPSCGLLNIAQTRDSNSCQAVCFLSSTFAYTLLPGCCCYLLCFCCHLLNCQCNRWMRVYHHRGNVVLPLAKDLDCGCSMSQRSPLMTQLTNTQVGDECLV